MKFGLSRLGIGNLTIGSSSRGGGGGVTPKGFITEWTVSGDATARTITLPLIQSITEGALSYDCTIDWGDGTALSTVTAYNDANRAHTYAENGVYQVEIKGTCEGWGFFTYPNDKLKITKIVNWGEEGGHNGWKMLNSAFYNCTNLTSLGIGKILASGTGVLTQGFANFVFGSQITEIPTGFFDNHPNVTTNAFISSFKNCTKLTAIPSHLFDLHTEASVSGFDKTFMGCSLITTIPTDLFRYNTKVSTYGFRQTFRECIALQTIPTDLFRYNTLVSIYAFYDCFQSCGALQEIPVDLFRYNTLASQYAFEGTFIECNVLTTVPVDLFRYNTLVSVNGFTVCFQGCENLETVPDDLFRYNLNVTANGFFGCFQECDKLQLNPNIWYRDGEQNTRFLTSDAIFEKCFWRFNAFTGVQGTAPDLWNCKFPQKLEVNVRPAILWVQGDIITGQTSGKTAVFQGWFSIWIALITDLTGNFTDGEIIGVTGVANKLADQGATYPRLTEGLKKTNTFLGAGNDASSISNYASIPASWIS